MSASLEPSTSTGAVAPAAPLDLARQITVGVSVAVAVVVAAVGSGAFGGTPIAEAAGGALSEEATLLAPGGAAFSIWTPIYLGLVAYAVWQALPAQRESPRQRRLGWWAAASALLNALWILVVQAGRLTTSVVVIVVLLATLITVFGLLGGRPPRGRLEWLLLDATMGLYLGWVAVATIAAVTADLVARDVGDLVLGADVWAVLVLVVAIALGLGVAAAGRGRLPFALAFCWGLAWIAWGRREGPDESMLVALFAAAATVIVALGTLVARIDRD